MFPGQSSNPVFSRMLDRVNQRKAESKDLETLRLMNARLQTLIKEERQERKTQEKELRDEIENLGSRLEIEYSKYFILNWLYGKWITQTSEYIYELEDKVKVRESQIGQKEKELIEDFEAEKKGIAKVISNLFDRTCKYKVKKRAMRIINEVINCEYPTLFTIEQASKILLNEDESYKIPGDTNISKAISDVFAQVVGFAKKYGLGFSWDLMQNKMCVLKYEPAKNKHPIKDVLNMLNEGLKDKYKFKIPTIKRKQAFNEPVKTPEDKPISLNELADEYCPELHKKVVENEKGTLSFSEFWKNNYPGKKEKGLKREYRGNNSSYANSLG